MHVSIYVIKSKIYNPNIWGQSSEPIHKYGRPVSIVTDKLRSYAAAMKILGIEDPQDCEGRWINNCAENSHQPFRRRERAMLKFRGLETLRKFVDVQGPIHNHFNRDRHLVSRGIYKQQRSAAMAEWKILAS